MVMMVKLRNVIDLTGGRYEYRRRVPRRAQEAVGKTEWKRVFLAKTGVELAREHARLEAEFAATTALPAPRGASPAQTPRAAALAAIEEVKRLVAGAKGLDDEDDIHAVIAEDLYSRGGDPAVIVALMDPGASLPEVTLEDARLLYLKEKLGGGETAETRGRKARLESVFGRLRAALGDDVHLRPLASLKREDARKLRDHMLDADRRGGGKLSPASVQRELKVISAVITFGLREFELGDKARNPFDGLEIKGTTGTGAVATAADKRHPLPAKVSAAVRKELKGDQLLIWRLLEGSGCRLADVTGLRVADVVTTGSLPHILIRWHEGRRVKTTSSLRSVPLAGDALDAAKAAMSAAGDGEALFPRYARERGPDAASAILMKHLRKVTTDTRHTVHSLRHGMKDKLRIAGVEKGVQDLILGHAAAGVAENYGSEEGRLEVAMKAMRKVVEGT